jgi:hypothetical protein
MSKRPAALLADLGAHTPSAMKKPEVIRIAVLPRPAERSAGSKRRRTRVVPVAVEQVGEEHAAEEHDFGQQEEPHAEAAGLALLLFRLEVMTVLRQHDMLVLFVDRGLVRMWMAAIALSNGRHLLFVLFSSHS